MSNHTLTLSTYERDIIIKHLTAEREKLDDVANNDSDKFTRAEAYEDAIEINDLITILNSKENRHVY
jgi:hypothetical protein